MRDRQGNKQVSKKREKQTRYLSQALQLEESVNPHILRVTMTMVSLALLSFVVWAGFTNIHEVARTPGEVVPQGYQQIVQHLEGGIVKGINVQEGDVVEAGDILLVMDDVGIREDFERAKSKQMALAMQEERLRAFTEGREVDFAGSGGADEGMLRDQSAFFSSMRNARDTEKNIVEDQITQKRQTIRTLQSDLETARKNFDITQELYERRLALNAKGYVTDIQILESRQKINDISGEMKSLENRIAVARTEMDEYLRRLDSLGAQHKDEAYERLDQVIVERAQNKEVLQKIEERMARLQVRAPVKGLIKGLSVNTVGAVVQPGQTLMEIVPVGKGLEVQVKISPQDIGHLNVGQRVHVKFSTFDFSRYGSIAGRLDQISATTFTGENGGRYYRGRVLLEKDHVGDDARNVIIPGMTVMADIITGDKTILEYLLKPVHRSLKTAFTER